MGRKPPKNAAGSEEGIFTTASDLFAVGVTAWSMGRTVESRPSEIEFQRQMTLKGIKKE